MTLQGLLAQAATMATAHNPGVSRYLWALAILAAGFAAAALGGRVIAALVRVALIAAAVLVAAKMVGMGL